MSTLLLPDIGSLDKESLCYAIYAQLYQNFFNAQDPKDEDHPLGIVEGDQTSIRLHNTAYNFASAISGAVAGDGGSGGGVLLNYLEKTGGDMTGLLRAHYGFEAGIDNSRILTLFSEPVVDVDGATIHTNRGVAISGILRLDGAGLYVGGHQAIRYFSDSQTLTLDAAYQRLETERLSIVGEVIVGDSAQDGLYLSKDVVRLHGYDFFHTGNANSVDIDWTMYNASVGGDLIVNGHTTHRGVLKALYGVELGTDGVVKASLAADGIRLSCHLSFNSGFGVRIGESDVLMRSAENEITLSAAGGNLLLGNTETAKIKLQSGLWDIDGEHLLITKYGAAFFPSGFSARHNYGADLLSTYRTNSSDEGVILHKQLRFGAADGCYLQGTSSSLEFHSIAEYSEVSAPQRRALQTTLSHRPSGSMHISSDIHAACLHIDTNAEHIVTGKPIEASNYVGISGSKTRLTTQALEFTDGIALRAVADGVKHSGVSYFLDDINSEYFASGYAGTGWAIARNKTTGNVVATFDELTVRRRMRAYEMEVKRIMATNGSLWVSDFCMGDYVEKLT